MKTSLKNESKNYIVYKHIYTMTMFTIIYNTLFAEKINNISCERHIDDPLWINTNWDKLMIYFDNNMTEFDKIVSRYLLINTINTVALLTVLHNRGYNIKKHVKKYKYSNNSAEVNNWLIDNKLMPIDICDIILSQSSTCTNIDDNFTKFKYAFEHEYTLDLQPSIIVTNIMVADNYWQYLVNDRNIDVKFYCDISTIEFLREYMDWTSLRGINDIMLPHKWQIAALKFGMAGINLYIEKGCMPLPGIYPFNKIDLTRFNPSVNVWARAWGYDQITTLNRIKNLGVINNNDNNEDSSSVNTDIIY